MQYDTGYCTTGAKRTQAKSNHVFIRETAVMGFIADLAKHKSAKAEFPGQGEGSRLWREAFGATNKEEKPKEGYGVKPTPGGSWGRSLSTNASFIRLLEAMRSKSPGGWSDDRWEQSRHFVGMTYVAIHRQNELLLQSEFQVFIKDETHPDGKRPVTPNDPPQGGRLCRPYDLVKLLEKPNSEDSFGNIVEQWNLQLDLTGTALTWMVPNKLGTPMELFPVPTATAIPQPVVNPDYPHGYYRIQPIYPYGPFSSYPTPNSAVGAPIPAEWMMRVKYPHPFLRYDGYSPLTAMRLHLDEIEGMDKSRASSMRNQITPSAVLNFENSEAGLQALPEEEIERVRAEFDASFMGPENAGRLFVAAPGSALEPWGGRPVDMDYQAGWDQLASFILGGGFGVTKPAAGMVEDSSYSTLFATLKQLYWITLDPKCYRHAAAITRTIAPFFGDNLIVEVRCKPINDHEINFTKIDKLSSLKGMPKSAIRVSLKLLDIAPTEELVEELSAAGDQQGGEQGGMGGMAAPGATEGPSSADKEGKTANAEQAATVAKNEATKPEPPEVTQSRPSPGGLSRGALGPRKTLDRLAKQKSFYQQTMDVLRNGYHKEGVS